MLSLSNIATRWQYCFFFVNNIELHYCSIQTPCADWTLALKKKKIIIISRFRLSSMFLCFCTWDFRSTIHFLSSLVHWWLLVHVHYQISFNLFSFYPYTAFNNGNCHKSDLRNYKHLGFNVLTGTRPECFLELVCLYCYLIITLSVIP